MITLTKAEEQIMHILWDLQRAVVRDVLAQLPDPKPAYNTVSTVIRVLENKGFVSHKSYGTTHEYYALVSKKEYTKFRFGELMQKYFNNSFPRMASFFAQENKLSIRELEEMMREIRDELKAENDIS
jgi:BlaI family penicillinase repressor